MKIRVILAAIVGISASVASYLWVEKTFPYRSPHCADNWHSYSIGLQGACSHHGGVVSSGVTPITAFFLCAFIGFCVYTWITDEQSGHKKRRNFGKSRDRKPSAEERTKALHFRPQQTKWQVPQTYTDLAELITQAISSGKPIQFQYSDPTFQPHESVCIKPAYLECHVRDQGNLYVVGLLLADGSSQTYSLRHMSGVHIVSPT